MHYILSNINESMYIWKHLKRLETAEILGLAKFSLIFSFLTTNKCNLSCQIYFSCKNNYSGFRTTKLCCSKWYFLFLNIYLTPYPIINFEPHAGIVLRYQLLHHVLWWKLWKVRSFLSISISWWGLCVLDLILFIKSYYRFKI